LSIDTDRLYWPRQQRELADGIGGAQLVTLHSPYGHDGFLIEVDSVGAAVRDLMSGR